MSKHLDNLKRISMKLGARYGTDDDLVQQLQNEIEKQELKKLEKVERRTHKLHPSNRSGVVKKQASLRAN
jgi:hypothetical protein